ncbi:MAG: hypothetical protein GWN01_16250 [Nitrosopumilaceae archaeon]|nr:hypothetical protein [Nitrosopumilaceae archaeon]NIU02389.1 hypothetical protein [Nitrosopumilaceae archaeon]NIU88846.1 hypothetical protein [Nitrosopumilaceae archaeon]NIV66970.1 hypothetical protein [Nitrosopumilaceae archaeon]NIX62990.1 hypothetical protein [Nitrosopumilaceae archaeon]
MVEPRKKDVFREVRRILSEHEAKGITKSELVRILTKDGTATWKTVQKYWENLIDEGILEQRKTGYQQKRCFPTKANQRLVKFENKLETVNKLLDFVEKEPILGDCFASSPKIEGFPEINSADTYSKAKPKDPIDVFAKNFREKNVSVFNITTLTSRRDLLKEIPSFLISYLGNPLNQYPEKTRTEIMKMINPIITKCYDILQRDYSKTGLYSQYFADKVNKNFEKFIVLFYAVKGNTLFDPTAEFLNILGRYYYCVSYRYSKDLKYENCNEQKLISAFIEEFFDFQKGTAKSIDEKYDAKFIKSNLENIKEHAKTFHIASGPIADKDFPWLDEINKSLASKLIKTDKRHYTDDPPFIKDYYLKLFFLLGLFSKLEKRIIQEDFTDRKSHLKREEGNL